jgi:hypothetical protein
MYANLSPRPPSPPERGAMHSRTFVLTTCAAAVGEKFWRYVFKQLFTICFYIKRQGVNFWRGKDKKMF